jgi:hypothetical protein
MVASPQCFSSTLSHPKMLFSTVSQKTNKTKIIFGFADVEIFTLKGSKQFRKITGLAG